MTKVRIIGDQNPTVTLLAEQALNHTGIIEMAGWVKSHRPECVPEITDGYLDLFPHQATADLNDGRMPTDNELLVELSGRKCYDSFGKKAGRRTNKEYIEHTQSGDVKHASILYHAKMTFFIAGISRRVSHELIRNYVGADREEEGSPSQESTRFTHHYGWFIAPPLIVKNESKVSKFGDAVQRSYDEYQEFIATECSDYEKEHGSQPKGIDRKRIYEAASHFLHHSCETSFIWTTNPVALAKIFRERGAPEADAEFKRLVNNVWKPLCLERWPNLFPGISP